MTHISNANRVHNEANFRTKEMRYLARSIGILALLTGLIYIRVIGMEALVSWQTNQGITAVVFIFGLLILAMIGLLCGWRWELIGGLIAVLSALGILQLHRLSPILRDGLQFPLLHRRDSDAGLLETIHPINACHMSYPTKT